MSITCDDSTVASSPGNVIISPSKFLDYYSVKGMRRIMFSILFKIPLKLLNRIAGNNEIVHQWIAKTEQFQFGCLNPSIILNVETGLIATYTNLTNNGGKINSVVKISNEKLHLIKQRELKNGQRIPSVAIYYRNVEKPNSNSWKDFSPLVPNCFTDNFIECDNLLKRLNENHWTCLNIGLEQIEDKTKIGLYKVSIIPEIENAAN